MSKRMGTCKQLVKVNGACLLQWVVSAAVESDLLCVYLILGDNADRILKVLPQLASTGKISILNNPRYETGMSSSVQCGVLAAQKHVENVMFILGDQPFFSAAMINLLLQEHEHSGKNICLPTCKNRHGNPVLFSKKYYSRLLEVEGDQGGRTIVRDNPADVHTVEIRNPNALFDIDTTEDLNELHRRLGITNPF
mgnify:CR=1 FL=1